MDPRVKPAGDEREKRKTVCFIVLSFADLVVIARSLYPIPSRTRPSKSSAPMVLNLKVWKSRSLPGLPRTERFILITIFRSKAPRETAGPFSLRWPGAVFRVGNGRHGRSLRSASVLSALRPQSRGDP